MTKITLMMREKKEGKKSIKFFAAGVEFILVVFVYLVLFFTKGD
jgi:hypothetical protein